MDEIEIDPAGFRPTAPEEPDREPPPEIKLAMAAFPVRQSKLTWRVVAYRSDGSFEFICGTNGPDYKLKRNAQKAADWYNRVRRSENSFAVVKRVRVTETECEEEEA